MSNVYINKDTCIGCGRCVDIVPEVFMISGTTSNIRCHEESWANNEGLRDKIKVAVLSCPSRAIDIRCRL